MNQFLVTVIQWIIAALFISGGALVIWMLIKNSGIGRLLKGILDAINDVSRLLGNQLEECSKDLGGSKCWLKWVFIGVFGAWFILGGLKLFAGLYRTRIDAKMVEARGKAIQPEEANRMEDQANEAYEEAAAKNPEKFSKFTEEDKIQIKKESIYRKFLRGFKKLLQKTDKTEQQKQAEEESMGTELKVLSKQASEDNPNGNDNDIDEAGQDMDDAMDGKPGFFE